MSYPTSVRHYDHTRSPSSTSPSAMTIPRHRDPIPPPLPPPQLIPELTTSSDPGWQWQNDPSAQDYGRPAAVKTGSSLLGGFHRPTSAQERTSHSRHAPREVTMTDESARSARDHRFQSERLLEHTTFQGSSQAYDKQLLSRIGGPSTPRKQSLSGSPTIDVTFDPERRNSQLRLEQKLGPEGSRRLPSMSPNIQVAETRHQRNGSAVDGPHEQAMFAQDDIQMENDRSPSSSEDLINQSRAGAKRRASSPPYDSNDRNGEDHLSPRRPHEYRYQPGHASLSSVSSLSTRGPASLVSSVGMASTTSSATSYASGMLSPPPPSICEHDKTVSYPVRTQQRHSAEDHAMADRSPRPTKPQTAGGFVCECCPKKPKRFETAGELKAHESEKQYGCMYCTNRFKNKNEAERHQNSLHLRRHSWSCAALAKPESAFHQSSANTNYDVCGFCGQEFPNPADWTERNLHLTQAHKFGQCNLAKKFFRADHFRQHLKHSHDGTSGKWTNMLESACMKDEPPPQKLGSGDTVLNDGDMTSQFAPGADVSEQPER